MDRGRGEAVVFSKRPTLDGRRPVAKLERCRRPREIAVAANASRDLRPRPATQRERERDGLHRLVSGAVRHDNAQSPRAANAVRAVGRCGCQWPPSLSHIDAEIAATRRARGSSFS